MDLKKYLRLSQTQLRLLETFVDDLLDLKQLKEGVFSLTPAVFDPNHALDFVCEIFEMKASAKGVKVFWEVSPNLTLHDAG